MVVVVWGLPIALLLLLFSQRWKCRIIRFGRRRRIDRRLRFRVAAIFLKAHSLRMMAVQTKCE